MDTVSIFKTAYDLKRILSGILQHAEQRYWQAFISGTDFFTDSSDNMNAILLQSDIQTFYTANERFLVISNSLTDNAFTGRLRVKQSDSWKGFSLL